MIIILVLVLLMHIHIVSIFPDIFTSFLQTSLIYKAQEKDIIHFNIVNPRNFTTDKQQQIDDQPYGGGAGMLIKAQPIIDAVENIIKNIQGTFIIIYPTPEKQVFSQQNAHAFAKYDNIIFVCGRYEGIDHRFVQYMHKKYENNFFPISLGRFVTLGGEIPSMCMIEAITRLVPGVIKEADSRKHESYTITEGMDNIEAPQYTRPEKVYDMNVPKELLSGDKNSINERKTTHSTHI